MPHEPIQDLVQKTGTRIKTAKPNRSAFRIFRWVLTVGLLGLAAVLFLNMHDDALPKTVNERSGFPPAASQSFERQIDPGKEAEKFMEEHRAAIAQTIQSDLDAVATATTDLNRYFEIRREQVDPFLDEFFSTTAKAKMLYYYLAGNGKLEKYIEETSFQYLGGPTELAEETARIVAVLQKELVANHNLLMLALEADLAALPHRFNLRRIDAETFTRDFHHSFDHALRSLLPRTVGVQLGVESIALAVDLWVAPMIGEAIAGALASRGVAVGGAMAAEGTALAAGAAGGWVTGGISLVVGLAIAVAIDYAANEAAKAAAEKKILAAFENWHHNAVRSFQSDALNGIRHLQRQRQLALKKTLVQEIARIASDNATP